MANSTKKKNKLYNYLVNTYNLSKDEMMELAKQRVDQLLEKRLDQLFESNTFQKLVVNQVTRIQKQGASKYLYEREPFDKIVKDAVREVVKEVVKEELNKTHVFKVEKLKD